MCSHGDHTPSLEQSDITLKSCCERDLEEQRRIEGYKETLLRDDPTQRRKQIAEEAVIRDIKRIPSPKDSDLSDDEDQVLGMVKTVVFSLVTMAYFLLVRQLVSDVTFIPMQRCFVDND